MIKNTFNLFLFTNSLFIYLFIYLFTSVGSASINNVRNQLKVTMVTSISLERRCSFNNGSLF